MPKADTDMYRIDLSEEKVRKALLATLLEIEGHNEECAVPGHLCPGAPDIIRQAEEASMPMLLRLLGAL